MKKMLAMLLAAALTVGLAACAAGETGAETTYCGPAEDEAVTLAAPEAVSMAQYPNEADYYDSKTGEWDDDAYSLAYDAWRADYDAKTAKLADAAGLEETFQPLLRVLLAGAEEENRVCSPLNVYLALAMLAEVTAGESRAQILDALGADSIETLRARAGALWDENSWDDGQVKSLLANSFWLREGEDYTDETLRRLAEDYHAAAFAGQMGSEAYDKALQDWINANTGNLLTEQAGNLTLDPQTVLALVSTIYFSANWSEQFSDGATGEDTFHAPGGDVTCDFMHSSETGDVYYGEGFTAIRLSLRGSGSMWLVRPEDGFTPAQLLDSPEARSFLTANGGWSQTQFATIELSLPKFDVSSDLDLTQPLQALGITDVFSAETADFSPLVADADELALSQAKHAARVKTDEDGCEAAAYTVLLMETTEMIEQPETVEFKLDRPFLFTITGLDGLPLFAGIVNQPV